jgi:hypothetical protein
MGAVITDALLAAIDFKAKHPEIALAAIVVRWPTWMDEGQGGFAAIEAGWLGARTHPRQSPAVPASDQAWRRHGVGPAGN